MEPSWEEKFFSILRVRAGEFNLAFVTEMRFLIFKCPLFGGNTSLAWLTVGEGGNDASNALLAVNELYAFRGSALAARNPKIGVIQGLFAKPHGLLNRLCVRRHLCSRGWLDSARSNSSRSNQRRNQDLQNNLSTSRVRVNELRNRYIQRHIHSSSHKELKNLSAGRGCSRKHKRCLIHLELCKEETNLWLPTLTNFRIWYRCK